MLTKKTIEAEAQKTIAEIVEKYRVDEGIDKIKENERLYKRNMELERMWKND